MEKYGYENIEKLALFGAEFGNVVEDLANKEGIFSVFKLADEAKDLAGVKLDLVLKELADLSLPEREALNVKLKAKIDLSNDVLEAKIEGGLDLAGECVAVGAQVLALIGKAKDLFAKPVVVPV